MQVHIEFHVVFFVLNESLSVYDSKKLKFALIIDRTFDFVDIDFVTCDTV